MPPIKLDTPPQQNNLPAKSQTPTQQKDTTTKPSTINPQPSTNQDPFEGQMVFVQGGTFQMGCDEKRDGNCLDDEKPVHSVTLSTYSIGKYEVTQKQWKTVMGEKNNPSNFKGDDLPVETVSWDDVQIFLQKLNEKTGKKYRLPTETEWEYAARGGNKSYNYKYSGSNDIASVAWFDNNSENKTHPVGQKQANELGIYDMSGNVWEWCSDWYAGNYIKNASFKDPKVVSSGDVRTVRGGGWNGNVNYCRVAFRGNYEPSFRFIFYGFRVAQSDNFPSKK